MDFSTVLVTSLISIFVSIDAPASTADTVQPTSKLEAQATKDAYDEAAHDADDNLCSMVKTATDTAHTMQSERLLDKASGTKNFARQRALTAQFIQDVRNVTDAQKESSALHGRVQSYADDCTTVSDADEAAMNDELFTLMKSAGEKVPADMVKANNKLKGVK